MSSVDDTGRTYPLIKPKDHRPPIPRWSLKLPADVTHIYTLYVGVQSHRGNPTTRLKVEEAIESILHSTAAQSPAIDTFRVTHGFDLEGSKVWVAYWQHAPGFEATLQKLNLERLWRDIDAADRHAVGLWTEHFVAPIERLETNYARLEHKPGLAQLPGTEQPAHELTAYWGAARDRIPASAHDLFATPADTRPPDHAPRGFGQKLTGTNYENMCHIRSGQWWAQCSEPERRAYETDLQSKLMDGMSFLWTNPLDTGTIGLRFLQNVDSTGELVRETCGAGFHRNWRDMERWSARHPSHLAIFNGMMAHARRFGDERKLMTWHEVWIFKQGEVAFEYVNCDPQTGVIRWVPLDAKALEVGEDET